MCLGSLGVIARTWDEGGLAMASVEDRSVCLMYTPEASVGDTVLIHLGFAVEVVSKERASAAHALRSEAESEIRKETT